MILILKPEELPNSFKRWLENQIRAREPQLPFFDPDPIQLVIHYCWSKKKLGNPYKHVTGQSQEHICIPGEDV